jgi:hypothetical protein
MPLASRPWRDSGSYGFEIVGAVIPSLTTKRVAK